MTISAKDWAEYIRKLSGLNERAAAEMREYVLKNGFGDMSALTDYAYALATKYGEGAAALSAAMYDATAEMEGKLFDQAELAETPDYQEVAKTVQGIAKRSQNADLIGNAVGRLVKRTGADTTLKNALRDGAEFAWVPAGDTCAFCITLASRGWQRASKAAIKGGHAEHIHANCDCTYAIRFDGKSNVAGYDPDKYLRMYEGAEGDTPDEKINTMRRAHYAENRERINEQKRAAYEAKKSGLTGKSKNGIFISGGIGGALDPNGKRATEHAERYYEEVRHMTTDVKHIAENTGFSEEEIQGIKNFVFFDSHELGDGTPRRFDVSYEMAESWQRLIEGKDIQPHDVTLLKHERMEKALMENGISQEEAHIIASNSFNYGKEEYEFYAGNGEH